MQARFYKHSKRQNSTLRPPNFGGDLREIRRTAPFDFIHPMFTVNNTNDIVDYNYIRVLNDGADPVIKYNYYFVTNWTLEPPYAVAHCVLDLLATYKDVIGASTQYVVRSASAKDDMVVDDYYKTYAQPVHSSYNMELPPEVFATKFLDGIWVIGILNDGAATEAAASSTYYVFNNKQMRSFLSALMTNTDILNNDDYSATLMKNIVNPVQYITYCQWFPLTASALLAYGCIKIITNVHVGWWTSLNLSAWQIVNTQFLWGITVPLKIHPQATERGNYLTHEPYTKYQCYFPGFGIFDVPAGLIYPSGVLAFQLHVDLITGASMLRLYSHYANTPDDYREVMVLSGQMGVDYGLGQVSSGKNGNIKDTAIAVGASMLPDLGWGILNGAQKIFTGKDLPQSWKDSFYNGFVTKTVDTVGSGLSAADAMPSTYGATGSIIDYSHPAALYAYYQILLPSENERIGSPLCKTVQIDTLSGYVQCKNAQIPMDVPTDIQSATEALMEGGFYFE